MEGEISTPDNSAVGFEFDLEEKYFINNINTIIENILPAIIKNNFLLING